MLEVSIRKKVAKLVAKLENNVHFTRSDIEHLLNIFVKLDGKKPFAKLDRLKFREILHHTFKMTDDLLLDRVFRSFDLNSDGGLTACEWVKGLSIFLRGALQERAAFAFRAYDLNSDGFLTREEIFHLLHSTLVTQTSDDDPDEGIRDLVDIVIRRLDADHDGKVNFSDFLANVQQDALLLELLGPCFPEEDVATAFLSTFQEIKIPNSIWYTRPRSLEVSTKTAN